MVCRMSMRMQASKRCRICIGNEVGGGLYVYFWKKGIASVISSFTAFSIV